MCYDFSVCENSAHTPQGAFLSRVEGEEKKNQSFPFSQPIRVIFAIEDFLWQVDEILNIKVGKENIIP